MAISGARSSVAAAGALASAAASSGKAAHGGIACSMAASVAYLAAASWRHQTPRAVRGSSKRGSIGV